MCAAGGRACGLGTVLSNSWAPGLDGEKCVAGPPIAPIALAVVVRVELPESRVIVHRQISLGGSILRLSLGFRAVERYLYSGTTPPLCRVPNLVPG